MDIRNTYEEGLKHPADFRVAYRFYEEYEGGRKTLPFQGYRSDFWYDYENHKPNVLFMIWPEFENENGEIIIENNKPALRKGTARMWVINPATRNYHSDKIVVGLKGYFREGPRAVAECTVIEIVGLKENPRERIS